MPTFLFRFSMLILGALVVTGCVPRVVPSGYLQSYEGFDVTNYRDVKFRSGPELELLDTIRREVTWDGSVPVEDGATTKMLLFVIQAPGWQAADTLEERDREELLRTLRERFYTWIGRVYPYPTLMRYNLLPDDPLLRKARCIFIESSVMHAGKGFGPARYFVGYGLGSVSLQVEGRLHEGSPSGPVLGEFAIRVRHHGYPRLFWNPKVFSSLYCLKHAANETSWHLMRQLKTIVPGPAGPPGWEPYSLEEATLLGIRIP